MKKAPIVVFAFIIIAMCCFAFRGPVMSALSFVPVPSSGPAK